MLSLHTYFAKEENTFKSSWYLQTLGEKWEKKVRGKRCDRLHDGMRIESDRKEEIFYINNKESKRKSIWRNL